MLDAAFYPKTNQIDRILSLLGVQQILKIGARIDVSSCICMCMCSICGRWFAIFVLIPSLIIDIYGHIILSLYPVHFRPNSMGYKFAVFCYECLSITRCHPYPLWKFELSSIELKHERSLCFDYKFALFQKNRIVHTDKNQIEHRA